MARPVTQSRSLGYELLLGKSRRYRNVQSGETISYNAFRRLASGRSADPASKVQRFERVLAGSNNLALARRESGLSSRQFEQYRHSFGDRETASPFVKEHGRWMFRGARGFQRTFLNPEGQETRATFSGRNLIAMQDYRAAVSEHSQAQLDAWAEAYPTQKPVALLERIINASSHEGDVVLDPFCGCGTTVHAAQRLKRQWIGIDVTHLAIALIEHRLKAAFPGIAYEVHGVPKDLGAARDLAQRDKHEFQKWIVATIEGQPYKSGKKGMDRGVDGYLHFRDANKTPQFGIISVQGGGIKSGDIRDLKGTMEREGAAIGIFLTLNPPTREMEKEAASAGIYETGGKKFPRLQILTAEQVIDDRRPQVPFGFTESLKKASRETDAQQGSLL